MKEAGYEYVVIDEGWWLGERDTAGNIVVNAKHGLRFNRVRKTATWPISPPIFTALASRLESTPMPAKTGAACTLTPAQVPEFGQRGSF